MFAISQDRPEPILPRGRRFQGMIAGVSAAGHSTPEELAPGSSDRTCGHCGGSGREPQPLHLEFSRSGGQRGSLRELSCLSGVSSPMISGIVAGQKTPSVLVLVKLAKALSTWMGETVTVDRIIRAPQIWKRIHRR